MRNIQLKTVSTVDAICNALEEDIFQLRFPAGAKITENDMVSRYGASRNTIREAIAYLLSNGLLVKVANKGVYVKEITQDDIQELFHLRELLETEALRTIYASGFIPMDLMRYAEALERIDVTKDWDEYVRADCDFHALLVAAAGSTRLSRLYETIATEVKLCIYQSHSYVPLRNENTRQHRRILEAIENGDLDNAIQILSSHIKNAIQNYAEGFQKQKERDTHQQAVR